MEATSPERKPGQDEVFDNNEPSHRVALIVALEKDGFDAYEYHSGGGSMHVVVDLYRDGTGATSDLLMIATGIIASPCDVSLMGWRNGGNVQNDDWLSTGTLPEAVTAFHWYWDERKVWITKYERGELDV